MKKVRNKIIGATTAISALLSSAVMSVRAQITNPALPEQLGGDSVAAAKGTTFTYYFVVLWRGLVFVGGLLVLVFFLWGAIEWITSGGDQAKIGKARDKMTQAVIGLVVLVGSFTIIGLISQLFFPEMNLLQLTIPTPPAAGS